MKCQVLKCNDCFHDESCFYANTIDDGPPQMPCSPSWQKTDEYEIVKKEKLFPGGQVVSKTIDISEKIKAEIGIVPNCALCRWKVEQMLPDPDNPQINEMYFYCSGQGLADADDVYGNENCIALYEPKPEPW